MPSTAPAGTAPPLHRRRGEQVGILGGGHRRGGNRARGGAGERLPVYSTPVCALVTPKGHVEEAALRIQRVLELAWRLVVQLLAQLHEQTLGDGRVLVQRVRALSAKAGESGACDENHHKLRCIKSNKVIEISFSKKNINSTCEILNWIKLAFVRMRTSCSLRTHHHIIVIVIIILLT